MKMHFLLCLLVGSLFAEPVEEAPAIKGVVLLGNSSDLNPLPIALSGIKIKNLNVPGGKDKLKARLSALIAGKKMVQDDINALKNEVALYWKEQNLPAVTVLAPEQDMKSDTLQLVVMESRVGQIEFSGNKHFPRAVLEKHLQAKPGEPVDMPQLKRDVAQMNANPFHHTEIALSPNEQTGTTDIRLITQDMPPLFIFGAVDDSGNRFTGNTRLVAGLSWANFLNFDQIFSYKYAAADNFYDFFSHKVEFITPTPWKHSVKLYGGFYEIHPDIPNVKHHGRKEQASFRYTIPVRTNSTVFLQDFKMGFDFKRTNENLKFENGMPEIARQANMTQFTLGYHSAFELPSHKFSLETEVFYSPGQWIIHQDKAAYSSLRPGATPNYIYGRIAFENHFLLRSWDLFSKARLQLSNANLLSSEQFTIGGYETVRGYDEEKLNADNSLCLNLEVRTPPVSLLSFVSKQSLDKLLFLVFADYGLGQNHQRFESEKIRESLLSVGSGLRYDIGPFLSSRLDWGFPLVQMADKQSQRVHFSMQVSY